MTAAHARTLADAPGATFGARFGAFVIGWGVPVVWLGFLGPFAVLLKSVLGFEGEGIKDPEATWGSWPGGRLFVCWIAVNGALLALAVWNTVWRQGRTGRSIGGGWCSVAIVDADEGRPPGVVRAFLRVAPGLSLGFGPGVLFPLAFSDFAAREALLSVVRFVALPAAVLTPLIVVLGYVNLAVALFDLDRRSPMAKALRLRVVAVPPRTAGGGPAVAA